MRSATLWFRVAAVIFVLFAAGHTFGFLSFKPPTPQGLGVRDAMDQVRFEVGGHIYSYGNFYRGFGLSISVTMLFEAVLSWWLGQMAMRYPQGVGFIGWAFVISQVAGAVLSFLYFSAGPAVFSLVLTAILAAGTWLAGVAAHAE